MIHANAIQQRLIHVATQGDAVWFEANPDRRLRLRNAVAQEFAEHLSEPPVGMTWRAIVVEAQPGVRARQPVALPIGMDNESFDDRELFSLFMQAAPKQARQMLDRLRKVKIAAATADRKQ